MFSARLLCGIRESVLIVCRLQNSPLPVSPSDGAWGKWEWAIVGHESYSVVFAFFQGSCRRRRPWSRRLRRPRKTVSQRVNAGRCGCRRRGGSSSATSHHRFYQRGGDGFSKNLSPREEEGIVDCCLSGCCNDTVCRCDEIAIRWG